MHCVHCTHVRLSYVIDFLLTYLAVVYIVCSVVAEAVDAVSAAVYST